MEKLMQRIDMHVGLILTGVLICLHVVFLLNAGALWRDEVNSIELAKLPGMLDIWRNLEYDSFPILWHVVVRLWIIAGMGSSDINIRLLGFIAGMGIIAALWWNARQFGYRIPLIALALIGFNATVISVGDSIRGYGIGTAMGLITIGAVWLMAVKGRYRDWIIALIVSLTAVHILYYNAVVLFAACVAGAILCFRMRLWKRMAGVIGIGLVAAVSLLPYLVVITKAKRWNMIVRYPINLFWIWHKFQEAMNSTSLWLPVLWACLIVMAILAVWLTVRNSAAHDEKENQVVIYAGVLLVVGTVAYLVFLKVLSYYMQPWYFIILIAMTGACMDAIFAVSLGNRRGRLLCVVISVVFVITVLGNVMQKAVERKTNIDAVAALLEKEAHTGDLIVLDEWYCGITFQRYYHGDVPWTTIPPLTFYRFHRFDLLQRQMFSRGVMAPVLSQIKQSLKERKRVWIIGNLYLPRQDEIIPSDAPKPDEGGGWNEGPYCYIWNKQMGAFLVAHGIYLQEGKIDSLYPVSGYENLRLFVIGGWRE